MNVSMIQGAAFLTSVQDFFASVQEEFYRCFIEENRYMYLVEGLGNTLLITLVAVIIGVVLGSLTALVRISYAANRKKWWLKILNAICGLYLTVIRGTPMVVQLLIMYYIIFGSVDVSKRVVAILTFGINSGAYVAEIVRSGIMAIDIGQFEAGRSLGLGYPATMWHIILPQAFKNVLPALINEMIVLLKETAIIGYIGTVDITKAATLVQSRTYSAFVPLISAAVFYLVLVMLLTYFMGKVERRMRRSEH